MLGKVYVDEVDSKVNNLQSFLQNKHCMICINRKGSL